MKQAEVVCKNCGNIFNGKYCNNCGEKIYHEQDKNIWHLLGEAFHFTTHFEGTFFNTLKAVLIKPGSLSLDYCNGIRKKYFKPISFFLLLVVIYLLFPVFEGLNQRLYYYAHNNLYGSYAMQKSMDVMHSKHLSEIQLSELFQHKAEKVSKFLLFIIIPIMAFITWLPHFKRRLFFDHFIFNIEESSFVILWGFLLLPLLVLLLRIIGFSADLFSEDIIGFCILIVFIAHVSFAAKRFFYFKWYYSILFALAYAFMLGLVIQYLYKFILFIITINQI